MRRAFGNSYEVAIRDVERTGTHDHGKRALNDVKALVFFVMNVRRRAVAGEGFNLGHGIGATRLFGGGLDGIEIAHQPEGLTLPRFEDSAIRVVQHIFAHSFVGGEWWLSF